MRTLLLVLVAVNLLFGAFTRNNTDETVYDDVLKLTWQDSSAASSQQGNWSAANSICNNLVFAGHTDWYLPTLSQLDSIIDTGNTPKINPVFQNISSYLEYWSSTSTSPYGAWLVSFDTGKNYTSAFSNPKKVRCVRDGAPTDINLTSDTIGRNVPVGTPVGTLSATDDDVGDTQTFSLACSTPGADDANFSISGNTLQSAVVFDYTSKPSCNICIRATDSNGFTFDKNFVITVVENSVKNADGSTTSATFDFRNAVTYMDGNGSIITEGTVQTKDGRDVRVAETTYPDGTAAYRVDYNATDGQSATQFDVPGAETVVGDDGNVTSTLSPAAFADVNGTQVQVVVTTDNEGKSTSRYVTTDANHTQQISWTADETTPFEPGNTIRVYEQNGTLDIEVNTTLTGTIKF
jgi:hypothetical protein